MPTSNEEEKATKDALDAVADGLAAKEKRDVGKGDKGSPKSEEEDRQQKIEDQLMAIEDKLFFDPPDSVLEVDGKTKHKIKPISWKKERVILKVFRKMLAKTPLPEMPTGQAGEGNISGIGNIANYVVNLVSDSDDEITEIFHTITGLPLEKIDDDFNFEVIMGTVLPFVLSLFGSAMKTVLKSMRFKKETES